MLKIHKTFSNKYFTIISTSILSIGALLGLSFLIYTPELSHAEITSNAPIENITYMQEITTEICKNTPLHYSKQLIDKRKNADGSNAVYWITKLKDGNCWMTQNLDLDLTTNVTLTSADTNITGSWKPTYNTQTIISGWDTATNIARSYNPGQYVYNTPTVTTDCKGANGFAGCSDWTKITADMRPSPLPNYDINIANDFYDAHYTAGNYYTYNAATADTGKNLSSGEAPGSICPSGWKLPSSQTFKNLFNTYGKLSGINAGEQNIIEPPLYFLYGGYINYLGLFGAGGQGVYWTSTPRGTAQAYALIFYSIIDPANPNTRSDGYSIRCMAPGGEKQTFNNVDITINPTIILETEKEIIVEKSDINPSTAGLDIKVASNMPYKIQFNTKNTDLASTTSDTVIPPKSGSLNTAENGWGIKKSEDTNYKTLTNALQTFYTASGAEVKTVPFTIGISTTPDLPAGEYSTNITVTATQN